MSVAFCLSLFVMAGCRNVGDQRDHASARQLFLKSVRLIELYTDSLINVSDSASYRRLKDDFDEKLAKVNFQFPADTDMWLTQEENDSLARMLDNFVKIVREKGKTLNAIESLPQDSIAVKNTVVSHDIVKPRKNLPDTEAHPDAGDGGEMESDKDESLIVNTKESEPGH